MLCFLEVFQQIMTGIEIEKLEKDIYITNEFQIYNMSN